MGSTGLRVAEGTPASSKWPGLCPKYLLASFLSYAWHHPLTERIGVTGQTLVVLNLVLKGQFSSSSPMKRPDCLLLQAQSYLPLSTHQSSLHQTTNFNFSIYWLAQSKTLPQTSQKNASFPVMQQGLPMLDFKMEVAVF